MLRVLQEAEAPVHWTVVLDRALRGGLIDPFTTPDVRAEVQRALAALKRDGLARSVATGVWALNGPDAAGP